MKYPTNRLFLSLCTSLVGACAFASGNYTWQWNPGMSQNCVYSDNFTGYVDQTASTSWLTPGSCISASQAGGAAGYLGQGKVAVVIDPSYVGYNLVAFNATISGIFLIDVTDGDSAFYSGSAWILGPQSQALNHYAGTGFSGASNAFAAGPGSMGFAGAPDNDGLASIGSFNPTVSNVSIAPVLTAVNPDQSFGVTITGIAVPEPASFVAVGVGIAALAVRKRRR